MAAPDVAFNPFEPGFAADPYPQWAALREHDPVHRSPIGTWLLLGYDDVLRFVRDPDLSVEDRHANPTPLGDLVRQVAGDRGDRGTHAMLNRDPPDHTRLRRLVSKAFTPRVIEGLRPRIQSMVDGILDRAAATGELEVVGDLAFPVPFRVITELLGMPDADEADLRTLSGTIVRSLEPLNDPELIRAIVDAGDRMRELVAAAIAWKRRRPGDDLLSGLIRAEEHGDVLSDDELAEQVSLLYVAGHETTVNLIGNGVLALLRHRDQLGRLRDDPALAANAVEELLRYDPPVQMTRRITRRDVEVGGRRIEAGAFVALILASANRDPSRWGPAAAELDLGRPDAHAHVAFGGGAHYCLGAALARLEGQIAIASLVRRFPRMEAAAEPVWNGRINLRGVERLPLRLAG